MRIAGLGFWEILALLALVLILFGPGRITKVAQELGEGIKAFKEGITGKDEEKESDSQDKE